MIKKTEIKTNRFKLLETGNIIVISAVLIIVLIAATVYEYKSNKDEIYNLLYEYSASIHHLVSESSSNSIISDGEIENLMAEHLLGVARNIKRLDSLNLLTGGNISIIAKENNVFRINIFDPGGRKVLSNTAHDSSLHLKSEVLSPPGHIESMFEGSQNEIIIGLKEARFEQGSRFAVAVKRAANKGVIVVNLDAHAYVEFKNRIGFEKLIRDLGSGAGIKYIVLQSPGKIMASNIDTKTFSSISDDEDLKNVFNNGNNITRKVEFENNPVLESVSSLTVDGKRIGIIRVGLSLDAVHSSGTRMLTRNAAVTFTVIMFTIIIILSLISNKNSKFISDEYHRIQTLAGNIIESLSPALITIDRDGEIIIFNKSAFKMLSIPENGLSELKLNMLKNISPELFEILIERKNLKNFELELFLLGISRVLLLNSVSDDNSELKLSSYSLLIEDITDLRKIERQLSLNEKFTAMGELASSVAHEIRNPLNTIIMISQRLEREFRQNINSKDFNSLLQILHSESNRVNEIIEQFLKFTKPPKLVISENKVSEFVNETVRIAMVQAAEKGVKINTIISIDGFIKIDYMQLKQAFINLLRNAVDATDSGGAVTVEYIPEEFANKFIISDTGSGISKENLKKIFDIYFTTKQSGTGMGLSIVRQVILQHNGKIDVESVPGKGSKFIITLPKI